MVNKINSTYNTQYITYTDSTNASKDMASKQMFNSNPENVNSTVCNSKTENNQISKEFDNALEPLFRKYGVSYNQIKSDILGILSDLGCKQIKNKEIQIPAEEMQKIVKHIESLLENLKNNNIEITAENLLNAHRNARDTKILGHAGITREEYDQLVSNGEAKGIREILGLKEGEEITPEKIKDLMKKQNEEFLAQLNQITVPEEKEQFIQEYVAKQRREFYICLVSTTNPKDRIALKHVFAELMSENKGAFFKDLLYSVDEETRAQIANSFDNEEIKAILNNPDCLGNRISKDDGTLIAASLTEYQNKETITKNEEDMMKEAREFFKREDVQAVTNKIENGEELTEEEKALAEEIQHYKDYLTMRHAGGFIGIQNNSSLSGKDSENLLKTMNSDAFELPTYREVMAQINSYIESNPDILTMSKEDFFAKMDEITNGNYTTVVNDINNGTTTELNVPTENTAYTNSSDSNNTTADLGFTNNTISIDITKPEMSKNELYARSESVEEEEKTTTTSTDKKTTTIASYKQYAKENGSIDTIKFVFRECKNSQFAINNAIKTFGNFNAGMQIMTLKFVNNFGLTKLLPEANEITLAKIKGTTFSNFYATQMVEKAAEDVEEKV